MLRLVGKKVVLRDVTPVDVERIYYWNYVAEDREHNNWNGPYKPLEPKTLEEFAPEYAHHLATVAADEPRTKMVIEVDGELIGTVGRYWVSKETNWFDTGIVIFDSRYWSGGYGTEAFQMWIDYLFTHVDTVRIGISTWSGNHRMIALAKKLGLIEEARIRKARIVRGEYYDSVKMGLLREEWEALRSRPKENVEFTEKKMLYGLFEAHLHVTNLERSAEFYENVLGLKRGHHEEKRRANFYYFDDEKKHMLGVWEVAPENWRREHVAFHSTVEDIKRAADFFEAKGIPYRNFDNSGKTPLKVVAWMPAISIFFTDPDGHSLELIAMLPDEPKPELGVVPWAEWEEMNGRTLVVR